ncbi:MAG: P1 family peptidase [Erysipelotrichaceae bacterium]|nr:P1 family peptidase [Erysipelotrichaceae bacterium]
MKLINIEDVGNVYIGHCTDKINATGCTVVISKEFAPTGLCVLGGGPASRETELTKPVADSKGLNAVVLTGGSAFGLDCAGGVMQYLEEQDIGYETGITKVPLVCASAVFDLGVANHRVRPDKKFGYQAARDALNGVELTWGNVGVGTGCSVGKVKGMGYAMKSGVGTFAMEVDGLKIGAIVAVNALGDIYEGTQEIAGVLAQDKSLSNCMDELMKMMNPNAYSANTTIGIVLTNAKLNKTEMNKVAQVAINGYARSIYPVNTSADGDSLYAMSVGDVPANLDVVCALSSTVVEKAILNAVKQCEGAYDLPSYKDIQELMSKKEG